MEGCSLRIGRGLYNLIMNTNCSELQTYLSTAIEAAHRGGEILESWRKRFNVREKARADLVTEADEASQAAIRERLLSAFPEHMFLGEEGSFGQEHEALRPPPDAPPTWVVDPLDGTANYVHDLPAYCVSIGLWMNGQPTIGVIYDPRQRELFTAVLGQGAFLNGEPIRVSETSSIRDSLLCTGFPSNYEAMRPNLDAWDRVSAVAQGLRRTGSTALNLAYVACGRFDGFWAYTNWAWDVMAGAVLVTEAGGSIIGIRGEPFDPFNPHGIATNRLIERELFLALNPQ